MKTSLIKAVVLAGALTFACSIGFAQTQEKGTKMLVEAQTQDARSMVPASATTNTATNPSAKIEALRVEAHQLYRAKNYARACPKYEAAAQLDPSRGDLWADLGLCLLKLGKKEKAKEAEGKAVDMGSKEVRLHAYYNLWKIGVNLVIPQNICIQWPCSRADCSQPLTVCRYRDYCGSGTGLTQESRGLAFCQNAADAKVHQLECNDMGESCFGIELESEQQNHCRPGDVGKAPCGACGCDEAPDPQACEAAVEECQQTAAENSSLDCTFVYADAERMRVGAICDGQALEVSPKRIARPRRHR